MKRYLFSLALVVTSLSTPIVSQTNDSTYLKYLNNNKYVPKRSYYISETHNILKTEVTELFDGNIPLLWEHRFNKYIGIEGGLGVILPYFFIDFTNKNDPDNTLLRLLKFNNRFVNKNLGFSLKAEPRLYFFRDNVILGESRGMFLSFNYDWKHYKYLDINQLGAGYGCYYNYHRLSVQAILSVYYTMQSGYKDITNIKYIDDLDLLRNTDSSTDLDNQTTLLKLYFRIQIGYIIDPQERKRIKK